MKVLMLIKHPEGVRREQVPQGLMDAMGTFIERNMKRGVLKDTGGLRGTADSLRVRQSRGKLTVIDGPFTEAKEIVGGYAMLEVNSMDEARDLARQFMQLHLDHWPEFEGECEVRPLDHP